MLGGHPTGEQMALRQQIAQVSRDGCSGINQADVSRQ
jgi:hypothetical protein